VVATFQQPFDLLKETTAFASRSAGNDGGSSAKSEIWLGRLDSNQGSRDQNPMP
jgi:site-specific DNA recombinase